MICQPLFLLPRSIFPPLCLESACIVFDTFTLTTLLSFMKLTCNLSIIFAANVYTSMGKQTCAFLIKNAFSFLTEDLVTGEKCEQFHISAGI